MRGGRKRCVGCVSIFERVPFTLTCTDLLPTFVTSLIPALMMRPTGVCCVHWGRKTFYLRGPGWQACPASDSKAIPWCCTGCSMRVLPKVGKQGMTEPMTTMFNVSNFENRTTSSTKNKKKSSPFQQPEGPRLGQNKPADSIE